MLPVRSRGLLLAVIADLLWGLGLQPRAGRSLLPPRQFSDSSLLRARRDLREWFLHCLNGICQVCLGGRVCGSSCDDGYRQRPAEAEVGATRARLLGVLVVMVVLDLAGDFDRDVVGLDPDVERHRRAARWYRAGVLDGVTDGARQQFG